MSEQVFRWPEWMPVPLRDGYSVKPVDRTLRTEMEIGSVKRVLYDTDETHVALSFCLSREQHLWFQGFEREMLCHGTRWFELPLLIGEGVEYYKVQIIGRPEFGRFFGYPERCFATFTVQIEKRKLLDGEVAEVLMVLSPSEIRILSNTLHLVLHTEMPGVTNYNFIEPQELIIIEDNLHRVLHVQMPGVTNFGSDM